MRGGPGLALVIAAAAGGIGCSTSPMDSPIFGPSIEDRVVLDSGARFDRTLALSAAGDVVDALAYLRRVLAVFISQDAAAEHTPHVLELSVARADSPDTVVSGELGMGADERAFGEWAQSIAVFESCASGGCGGTPDCEERFQLTVARTDDGADPTPAMYIAVQVAVFKVGDLQIADTGRVRETSLTWVDDGSLAP